MTISNYRRPGYFVSKAGWWCWYRDDEFVMGFKATGSQEADSLDYLT
jgi:hypothetical protein